MHVFQSDDNYYVCVCTCDMCVRVSILPAYLRRVGPISLQCGSPFDVGIVLIISFHVAYIMPKIFFLGRTLHVCVFVGSCLATKVYIDNFAGYGKGLGHHGVGQ